MYNTSAPLPAQTPLDDPLPGWPEFTSEEADAARAVIASNRVNYWTGEHGRAFEREFARWSGSAFAVALCNGTVALDLALRALEIGPGDEVVVTPRSFIASVSSVVNAGATPVFADVDRDSGNISAQTIAPVLSRSTRAILPVHLAGWPCDMHAILALARQEGIAVIEDCAQAHGAKIGSHSVGTLGDVGTWSFCQDKIITTGGEGGMVTTGNTSLWRAMWSLKDHGKDYEAAHDRSHPPGFRYLHERFGHNWRMPEVQAAIGRIQLPRLSDWTAKRTRNAMAIAEALGRHPELVRVPLPAEGFTHAFYRLYAYVRPQALRVGWDRDRIIAEMTALGVPVMQGSCPEIYCERAFDATSWRPMSRLPVARELGETSLAFLVHPTMDEAHAAAIAERVDCVLRQAH